MGDSGEQVVDIVRDWRSSKLDEQDKAMLEFVEKMTLNASGMTKRDVEALQRVGISDVDIVNITVTAGMWNFLTRYTDALGIEFEEWAPIDQGFTEAFFKT